MLRGETGESAMVGELHAYIIMVERCRSDVSDVDRGLLSAQT
jgi:hypothetical protein